ncbi:hypothetical protein [Acidianus sp. HS-5]|uniref:hypothetical protein n=1 Tax=Acidianus sp. HS-5 TaxID=2886040 RepID=UPI001F483F68|nr:hypothetical protein [Acidianus sp. HS-5]BDC17428.1 hypothetical protein HS5_03180 [Acidianus sp. HS-5]
MSLPLRNMQLGSLLIGGQLSSGARGFLVSLGFKNIDRNSNVEIWFPIDGYIDLIKNEGREYAEF